MKVAWFEAHIVLHYVDGLSVTYLGKRWHKVHYGKKAGQQRQCDALGNVLLRNLGSCYLCEYYFDM